MIHARRLVATVPTLGAALSSVSLLLALLVLAPAAHAAGAKRAGVPKFEGAQEALVRKQVMQALKAHGFELAKSREMDAGMQSTGALLESDDGFQKVAKELALTVIVTGEIGKKRAKIVVHDGREGSVLGEASFPGANPRKIAADVGKAFWSKLGGDIERGKTPSGAKKPQKAVAEAPEDDENTPDSGEASAPAAEEEKSKVAASEGDSQGSGEGDDDSGSRRKKKRKKQTKTDDNVLREEASPEASGGPGIPPTLELAAGAGGVNRSYGYNQDASGLPPYSLPLGGAAAVHAVWYPSMGPFADGALQNLGVELGLEQAFGVQSSLPTGDTTFPAGATFGNTVHDFEGGIRYRIPFGEAANQVWFSGTGGEHAFLFTGRSKYMTTLDIPDVIYRYARAGAGIRLELPSSFSVGFSAGYRAILNNGGTQFRQFFPHATVQGVDAELYVGYRLTDSFEGRAGLDLRRYFSSMHSVAADTLKAGGAIDQYWSFGLGIAYLYGGSPRPAAAAEEEAPAPKKKHRKHHQDDDQGDAEGGDASGGGEAKGGGDAE